MSAPELASRLVRAFGTDASVIKSRAWWPDEGFDSSLLCTGVPQRQSVLYKVGLLLRCLFRCNSSECVGLRPSPADDTE
jgi:hypothetical protein